MRAVGTEQVDIAEVQSNNWSDFLLGLVVLTTGLIGSVLMIRLFL